MGAATWYAIGNVLSSVAIVLVNKRVRRRHAPPPPLLLACNLFELPSSPMPEADKFKVAFAGVASIGFMNVSLSLNSVGFYQVTKLTIVPVTLLINFYMYTVSTTHKVKLSLLILLAGVGIATVSDVDLRPLGLAFGVLAVLSTAMFQIWQGTKQKEYGMSGTQLQYSVSFYQALSSCGLSLAVESFCLAPQQLDGRGVPAQRRTSAVAPRASTILATCFLALLVNWCSFGLIGKTSPITFQVVGHAKTCLVLIGGYVFFPVAGDAQQLYNNIAGVTVAMFGVVLYGHLKHASSEGKPDCLDSCCPAPISRCLDVNKYATVSPSETEGLTRHDPDDSKRNTGPD
ncbi:hypothetical protein EMIHUDRAFT_114379 [Emiliania huxleyi CCMP1516]|uniref:Sugar phosphate transporter domain-containing protein n=2 Tax=Emiliania huxleyi TaxID=2903 RepID=A0A0D3JX08_EMIH1|nr:hypothetical protein EMIHUDRAFT_114379 [Emiliania huxleyi CCMP1516]EOD28043.1 hypothetical protein EMIHUDRAFT_114379 [Emiliania huxleyi CCMP1516]|eukprot:XP_005780472.1 hypothetical protein EMIHUDRAFT_114379 [Emiliania huxleyi CCMP1516]